MRALRIYRPNEKISGAAFQFKEGYKRKSSIPVLFVEAVNQSGPKPAPGSKESPFNWKNKLIMMFSAEELGQMLAYIRGYDTKPINIVHTTEKDGVKVTASFNLKAPETEEEKKYNNWKVTLGRKTNEASAYINSFFSTGQVMQLSILAEGIIKDYFLGDDEDADSNIVDQ